MVAHTSAKDDMETFRTILSVTTLGLALGSVVAFGYGAATQTLTFFGMMWILVAMTIFMMTFQVMIDLSQRFNRTNTNA